MFSTECGLSCLLGLFAVPGVLGQSGTVFSTVCGLIVCPGWFAVPGFWVSHGRCSPQPAEYCLPWVVCWSWVLSPVRSSSQPVDYLPWAARCFWFSESVLVSVLHNQWISALPLGGSLVLGSESAMQGVLHGLCVTASPWVIHCCWSQSQSSARWKVPIERD